MKADPLAASDPNAKSRALLDEFNQLPEGDRQDWVMQKGFELSVFDGATDPQIRAEFERTIKPLQGQSPTYR